MKKINVLDKSVYNLISAGEVVEKPSSIIKECVENSLDAGAKNISIEIVSGGIKRVRVSDDGCGIEKDDLPNVFLAHATSKIKIKDDLEKIGTFGFRGEALASIGTVSKVTLISKTDSSDGNKMVYNGGELISIEPIGSSNGTSIIVEDLFYNIPARAKFLRKPKLEENDITNLVARFILCNPEISFKYFADDKLIYQSYGKGLKEAIFSIYGMDFNNVVIPINNKNDRFLLSGFIGFPTFSKPNRTYQTFSINNRYVINQTVSMAVFKAYENYLMKGQFPFFVLNLSVNLDFVDVNVHPNKLDVKFENSNEVFVFILNSISKALLDASFIKNVQSEEKDETNTTYNGSLSIVRNDGGSDYLERINVEKNNNGDKFNTKENSEKYVIRESDNEKIIADNEIKFIEINGEKNSKSDYLYEKNIDKSDYLKALNKNQESIGYFLGNDKLSGTVKFACDNGLSMDMAKRMTDQQFGINRNSDGEKSENPNNSQKSGEEVSLVQQKMFDESDEKSENNACFKNFKVVGTIFNTYILIEKNDEIFIIDQHAGHERILFDKFKKEFDNRKVISQNLLVPYVLTINSNELNILDNNLNSLSAMGFDIEEFGNNTYKIDAVPLLLKDISLNEFFNCILKENQINSFKSQDLLYDYIAKNACRSAVKANDILNEFEIKTLIDLLSGVKTLLCPHGRPIIIKISKSDIEKWFKRIV